MPLKVYCKGVAVNVLERPDGTFCCSCCGDDLPFVVKSIARLRVVV